MDKNPGTRGGLPGPEDPRRPSEESKSTESKRPSIAYSEQSDPNHDKASVSTAARESNARNPTSLAQDSNQFSSADSNASGEFHEQKSIVFNDNQDERHNENVREQYSKFKIAHVSAKALT